MATSSQPKFLSFETVLPYLKHGSKITRTGWNGHGMFLYYVPESDKEVSPYDTMTDHLVGVYAEGQKIHIQPHIYMKYANGNFGVWTPTIEDILAMDWLIFK
jgi:hypothetical protein